MKYFIKTLNLFVYQIKRFIHIKHFIFLLCMSLFFHPLFAELTWELPAQDVFSAGSLVDPSIIVTSSTGNNVHLIWTSATEVYTSSSNDFGDTWNVGLRLSVLSDGSSFPSIATNASGQNAYVLFEGIDLAKFSRSTDGGTTWNTGVALNVLSGGNVMDTAIATNATGANVYALWDRSQRVEFSRSTDSGATWPAPGGATEIAAQVVVNNTRLVTSSSGEFIHAAWAGRTAAFIQTQTATSSDFGVTWSGATALTPDDANIDKLQLATDSSGTFVYAIWQKSVGGVVTIQFARSTDSGGSWTPSPGIDLSDGVKTSRDPTIATDSTGQYVYVAWAQSTLPHTLFIRRSTDFGASFEAAIPFLITLPTFPDIATDDEGNDVYVIWNAFTPGFVRGIQVSVISSDFGVSYSSQETVSSATENSFLAPTIASSNNGEYAYASFDRDSNKVTQALKGFNQSPPPPPTPVTRPPTFIFIRP